MTASSVTGTSGPGMSNGKYKPQNNSCRYGCGNSTCEEEREKTTVKKNNCFSLKIKNC